ncbi:hypothetical protein BSG1_09683 [Bacillus sp. SG-1]|nr:hypothetical protein BSG1_09683 [Bacillus sp. SG-1]
MGEFNAAGKKNFPTAAFSGVHVKLIFLIQRNNKGF